ncbi:SpoIIE family protein phosphatase [Streptosporangium sp. NPDC048047]|uniref:PP2C family protein-serine/threonine phosphatase n=1 Tax=Streptosporangium sp. NPDC048047 TaxID=3155748 RepID=UPI00342F5472
MDLYENAPCGYLSTLLDGKIAKINETLLAWLGYTREQVVGRMSFTDLLTVGGRLYHETHYAPLLRMRGEISGIAFDLKAADGSRLPVLVTSTVTTGTDGQPLLIRTSVFDARDRRAYETELLRARKEAEKARREAEQAQREAEEARLRAERERERLQNVLATLQLSLLPPVLPEIPGLETSAHYHTASPDRLGGDFYDLFSLGDGRWGFFLGDVCGKGPAAAAMTSLTRYSLRAAAVHNSDPVTVLTTLNTVLLERYTGQPRFCTVVFGILEPEGKGFTLTLASGGHPPALLLRAGGGAEYLPTPGGVLVGVLPRPPFTRTSTVLSPGDTVLMYTDGLTEARVDSSRALFGDGALLDFAARLAPATAGDTITAVTALLHGFGEGLDDDTATMAFSVPALGATGKPA